MSFAGDILDAHAAGRRAAQQGALRSTCPHDPDSSDPRTRNLFVSWMRGYASVVPTPVDYSG
ncbi:Rmf/CrpP family protein [Nocardiopsis rhodophaea]|uniref:Rmf/CrpP family protein n=1 Tax=Nocardiopsis rhodophaea TaxID=280238 RepID=UPI0031D96838